MQTGDTLWKIAHDEFGVAELYLLIEGMNGVKGSELKAGQEIEIPLHHEVCEAANYTGNVVRNGDSMSKKIERGELPEDSIHTIQPRSGDVNLIYPFEILNTHVDTMRLHP